MCSHQNCSELYYCSKLMFVSDCCRWINQATAFLLYNEKNIKVTQREVTEWIRTGDMWLIHLLSRDT